MSNLRKTPLLEIHKSLGARIVPFAGWEMPVQYSGVMDEHKAVREAAGLFDVSHMGEIEVKGEGALDFVQLITTNDASKLSSGEAQYSLICYPDGGIVDDTLVYKISDDKYMLCVNASNVSKDLNWIREQLKSGMDAEVRDLSDSYALLALQGPKASDILDLLTGGCASKIKTFSFGFITLFGENAMVSRTGYTGEDGFEIFIAPEKAAELWRALMEKGEQFGIKPIGLGARDTLRLEMKYTLYGNDIDAHTTPLDANLGWVVKFEKNNFIGKDVLCRQKEEGTKKKLISLAVEGRGIPRPGYEICKEGKKVGRVTSGTMSPSLGIGIAMAYLEPDICEPGTTVDIMIRDKAVMAKVVRAPFYKKTK
ncbi:MAG: glycine cleavage system aminomethyltransferase GcvT [bacterium]|nr:glycine cleavage system aminomethyltransferase GcvT [bacterium]